MKRIVKCLVLTVSVAGAAVLWAMLPSNAGAASAAAPAVADVYAAKCASCHGADGSGNTPIGKRLGVRDLRSQEVQGLADGQLAAATAAGKGKVPGFGKSLPPDQIQALVGRVRALAR